jgi:hypothetical protein
MDKFILDERNYKKFEIDMKERDVKERDMREKEVRGMKDIKKKEKIYNSLKNDKILFKEKNKVNSYTFQNDFFHLREKGDKLLNQWIIKQKDPIIIFLSEFIDGTKISKEIEKFRPIIKTTPTISIEEYRKIKKIGEEGVDYLKRLRDKYGVIVLKVLWANLNFNN